MTYWTLEEVTKLHILRRNGATPLEISVVMGKTETAVKVKLCREKKRGLKFGKLAHKARKHDSAVARAWRQLVRDGLCYREIYPARPATVCEVLAMEARGEL